MMRNIPIAVPPPSVLCERNTHSQFPVYGPGDHITSSERTILVRCVRGEDHEVPGPIVFLHYWWRHFLFFSCRHPHVSAGGDWRPQPSSRSGGWHPLPPHSPRESTRGTGRNRASGRRSERSCCHQTPAVDPAHRAKRCL